MNKEKKEFIFFKFIFGIRRQIWWFLLLVGNFWVIYHFKEDVFSSEVSIVQISVITLIALLFLPIVKEFSFGGFTLKKELEKTTSDIKKEIMDLKISVIQNNSNSSSSSLNLVLPSPELVKDVIQKNQEQEDGLEESGAPPTIEIDKDNAYLLKIRQNIEQEINEIFLKFNISMDNKSIVHKLSILSNSGYINSKITDRIGNVISICNRGIHGEIVDKQYIEFVRKIYPTIYNDLKTVMKVGRMVNYMVNCHRCHYTGPSHYDNVCPDCGQVTDEH